MEWIGLNCKIFWTGLAIFSVVCKKTSVVIWSNRTKRKAMLPRGYMCIHECLCIKSALVIIFEDDLLSWSRNVCRLCELFTRARNRASCGGWMWVVHGRRGGCRWTGIGSFICGFLEEIVLQGIEWCDSTFRVIVQHAQDQVWRRTKKTTTMRTFLLSGNNLSQ